MIVLNRSGLLVIILMLRMIRMIILMLRMMAHAGQGGGGAGPDLGPPPWAPGPGRPPLAMSHEP